MASEMWGADLHGAGWHDRGGCRQGRSAAAGAALGALEAEQEEQLELGWQPLANHMRTVPVTADIAEQYEQARRMVSCKAAAGGTCCIYA